MQALGLIWGNHNPLPADVVEVRKAIGEPKLYGSRLLLEQWRQKTAARSAFVIGRDVPSRALACVLRNLAVYEPLDGAADFRVRLAGTAFTRRFGRDVTSLALGDIRAPRDFESDRARLAQVLATGAPIATEVMLVRRRRVLLQGESVALPVQSPDGAADWVLDGLFYSDWA